MSKEESSYLKHLLDAEINAEENKSTFIFQKERIGLNDSAEINFLMNEQLIFKKDIIFTEDEVIISVDIPKSFMRFQEIWKQDEKSRLIFAYQLVEMVANYPYQRLTKVVCPENLVFDLGMTPYLLHLGVRESLPPMVEDSERIWIETKAVIASVVDNTQIFEEYVKYFEALDLKPSTSTIMSFENPDSLKKYIKKQIERVEEKEKSFEKIPLKKWKSFKISTTIIGILIIPAFIFIIYTFIYEKPRNEAYLNGHEAYLMNNYSEVVTILESQRIKPMPYVVLYELAHSFVINERLDDEQKRNVLNNLTLLTDEDYLEYWIYIGRGEAEKAIDLARLMEDGELITYGLLKRREEIQAEKKLTGVEKEDLLREIDDEVNEFEKLMDERNQLLEEETEEELEKKKEKERIKKEEEQEKLEEKKQKEELEKQKEAEKTEKPTP